MTKKTDTCKPVPAKTDTAPVTPQNAPLSGGHGGTVPKVDGPTEPTE
jgi:hypothetical protein